MQENSNYICKDNDFCVKIKYICMKNLDKIGKTEHFYFFSSHFSLHD